MSAPKSVNPNTRNCSHLLPNEQWCTSPFPWWWCHLWKCCLNHAARTDSISSSSRYFSYFHHMEEDPQWIHLFYLLHNLPQLHLMWTLKVQAVMPHQQLFQYVYQVPLKYLITCINNFHFILSIFPPFDVKLTLSPHCNLVFKTGHMFPACG